MDNYLQRKQRGWIEENDLFNHKTNSRETLISMLHSQDACDRTIAAKLLPLDCETKDILLHSLMTETALYTRLAMTEKLEGGDSTTALKMIGFLGKIGKNQHRVPIAPSKKKSFPLPRDLMARSLGRMNPELFPVLLASAEELPPLKLSELIDAIGYMAFYHPALATAQNYQRLLRIKNSYGHDPLIQWKCLICFSAFPQSKDLLAQEDQFSMEAQRSLSLLALKRD